MKAHRKKAAEALRQFDVVVTGMRLVNDGYNVTYRVETEHRGRFALRVSRPALTPALVSSEALWCEAIAAQTDVRVLRIERTRKGEPLAMVDGQCCVLTGWVNGVQRSKGLSPNMVRAVGRTMARLHQHGAGWQPPEGFHRPVFDTVWLGAPSPIAALPAPSASVFAEAEVRLLPVLRGLVEQRCHIVHGDLHQWNYRFARGHDVGVIDFDDCALANPIQDIAISFYYLRRHPQYETLAAAFEEGYRELEPWPLDDELLQALLIWRAMGLCASVMDHENPRLRQLGRDLLPKWTDSIQQWLASG